MSELALGDILFYLAIIFLSTLMLGTLLSRLRIPIILAGLFVGVIFHYFPQASHLNAPPFQDIFSFLADLGVLFLLLYIGLKIDLKEMKKSSRNILYLTLLNTILPFIFGMAAMLFFGYGWLIAFVIGMTRMPTAEAVIVPILDEFKMIKTKIGTYIIGAGVLDDIIEVFLVAFVSIWIGIHSDIEKDITTLSFGILSFLLFSWIMYRYFSILIQRFIPQKPISLLIMLLIVLFIFGSFSEKTEIGMVVGAIISGIVLKPVLSRIHPAGESVEKIISMLSYGFFGILFFFWIGFNIDFEGFIHEPLLAIVLYLAGTLGKLFGTLLMVPLHKMRFKEAVITGIGLDARLTTEIIVAQLLFTSGIIDTHLFTALVAASSFTAISVPLLFTLCIRLFGKETDQVPSSRPAVKPLLKEAWHSKDIHTVLTQLQSDPKTGISPDEAKKRLAHFGTNNLRQINQTPWYLILIRQFTDILILILIAAALISLAIGEITDAVTIMIIVILNGILGFVQEYKAQKEIEALQKMLHPTAKVIRDKDEKIIDAKLLVPGDIVILEIGDHIPADIRLVEVSNLKVDESALTGESASVMKSHDPVAKQSPLALQNDMAWMGTTVVNGWGKGIIVATGMQTEFGKIAKLTQSVEQKPTLLQKKLAVLGKKLGIFSLLISLLVAVTGWLLGKDLLEMFLTGVSLAVAVVPEGLPAVVTITLALGIKAMVKQKALLRHLQAAETLGATTVICTDKTGTLTQNQMTVKKIWLAHTTLDITGLGYDPAGHFEKDGVRYDYQKDDDLKLFLKTSLMCNHAQLQKEKESWDIIGEPTEASLIVAAYKAWMSKDERQQPVSEFSFNSERKRMSVLYHDGDHLAAFVKGAPEVILERSRFIMIDSKPVEIDETMRQKIIQAYEQMAKSGLRTLALAYKDVSKQSKMDAKSIENNLVFLGIAGIIDPPHKEVPAAIQAATTAGVKVIMITGDNPKTARAIAKDVGLEIEQTRTSDQLQKMDDMSLQKLLTQKILFARAKPEDKMRIVQNLQKMNHIVAMTGDGVNDTPALKQADVGIAMGKKGTDVAKSASDMVLLDDNFATIINALKEGRRQYDNIQKFVRYLLSSNTGEIIAIFVNVILGGPLILLPVQILWMNLVTDGMTAVALGLEPAEKGVLKRPPRDKDEMILTNYSMLVILLLGAYIGGMTLWLYHYYLSAGTDETQALMLAQTVAFTGIIILEKINVFNFRSLNGPLGQSTGWLANKWLLLAVAITIGLQVCAVYVPFLQEALHTTALGWKDWGILFAAALPIFLITEAVKWIKYIKDKRMKNA